GLARFGPTTPTRARRPFDASVDPTEARRRAADRRSGGGEPNLILWPHKGVPILDHPPPGRPGRVTTSAVHVAAGGSRSGCPPSRDGLEKVRFVRQVRDCLEGLPTAPFRRHKHPSIE